MTTLRTLATTSTIPATLVTEDGNPFYVQPDPVGEGFALNYVFVLKPGAIQQGNVYADSNNLYAAVQAQRAISGDASTILIEIDGSIAPVAWLASGSQNLSGVTFFSSQTTPQGFTMTVNNGVVWTFDTLFVDGAVIVSQGGTTPVTVAGGATQIVYCINQGQVAGQGAAAFFHVTGAGSTLQLGGEFSFFGDGTHHTVTADAGTFVQVYLFNFSSTTLHLLDPTSAGSFSFVIDAGTVLAAFDAPLAPTVQFVDQAARVGFPPTTPANWNPVPAEVQQALDQLAQPSFQNKLDPGQAAAATVTLPGTAVTQKKSGACLVIAVASLVLVGDGGTVTGQLFRDAVAIGPLVTMLQGSGTFELVAATADQLPTGGASHTYTLVCTVAGTNTLSTAANTGIVTVIET